MVTVAVSYVGPALNHFVLKRTIFIVNLKRQIQYTYAAQVDPLLEW